MNVVFDTNILFSAVGWRGAPFQCVAAAREGHCASMTCESILSELHEKLRLKRGFSVQQADEVLSEILAFSQDVPISHSLHVVAADADDDAVVECAMVGKASFLISGDRHLLTLKRHQEISIVTAAEFLEILQRI